MENMLYIIAGLVLILLIAGLVLRKKKAQPPSAQPQVKSRKMDSSATIQSDKTDDKFDHITIAQRFMDQQRYDKAIETLNRGLIERPKNNQLSLKLLSIYATINQPENFNKVYDAIKTQNDAESMVLADELKTLFFEDNIQFETQEQKVAKDLPASSENNFGGLDFDLPTSQADNQHITSTKPAADSNNAALINGTVDDTVLSNDLNKASSSSESVEDSFDLTLSDLENDLNESDVTDTAPVTSLDVTNNDRAAIVEDSDFSDFDFSLDSTEESDALTSTTATSEGLDTSNLTNEEMSLENEEFILDFDDLATDSDKGNEVTIAEVLTSETHQSSENDFTLSLDDFDESVSEKPAFEANSDIDNFVLENSGFEEGDFESIDLEEAFNDNELEVNLREETSTAPTAPLLFDDNTSLDDAFDFDAQTAITPVDVETTDIATEDSFATEKGIETAEDFSSRFAADFDFIKSLDSNQVTLDLASQYIQLGEYDSAKRLLNEVVTQGNSEQQSQAQALLERTA